MRSFLRTEAGSSGVLAAAILVALLWANLAPGSYDAFWRTDLSFELGDLRDRFVRTPSRSASTSSGSTTT